MSTNVENDTTQTTRERGRGRERYRDREGGEQKKNVFSREMVKAVRPWHQLTHHRQIRTFYYWPRYRLAYDDVGVWRCCLCNQSE